MADSSIKTFPEAVEKKVPRWYRVLHFPLTKIIIGIACIGIPVAAAQIFVREGLKLTSAGPVTKGLAMALVTALFAICTYIILYRHYENRKITELSGSKLLRNVIAGILLGALLQSLTIFVIYVLGGFTVLSVNSVAFLLPAFSMAISSAIFEEVLVRGVLFRHLEEMLGSYMALAISALVFGALHLANPNSSIGAAIGLALQAGTFLGAAFIYTRSLWFPIAIHFAWNFMQGGIYGAAVSGSELRDSLLTTIIEGQNWFTGGRFGPEGSVQATFFCFTATVVLMIMSHREGKIIHLYRRNRMVKTIG